MVMIFYFDKKYSFYELFNENNGTLVRSNVLCNGIETCVYPDMRSFPELLDVGIMGNCHAASMGICSASGVDCYQNAPINRRSNMSLKDYLSIINQCKNKTFQIALGGAGDPNKHEKFEEILIETTNARIVPNLTTSGYMITEHEIELMRKYCGAVAVSFYSKLDKNKVETNPLTIDVINKLISAGCVTNIHYVVSKSNIDEAIFRLKNNLFPKGANAIVFLLYKPVGMASKNNTISVYDKKYLEFLKVVESKNNDYKIGFDSCQSPALTLFTDAISQKSIEFCEASRFSMYIDSHLKAFPCSFGIYNKEFEVDLNQYSIKEAWESEQFDLFRLRQTNGCADCTIENCRTCGIDLGIKLCNKSNT
ncbi:MAG: radical SAM protein [Ruminococcaceae bacterium]|nr:radical SAM protein [Oscillospiraceae bacterium]